MKGVALAVVGAVLASGCGQSQRTQEGGGDIGSSGSAGLEPGGTGGGGIAGQGGMATGGSAGNASDGGRAGAGGLGEVGGAGASGSGGFAGVPLTDAEVCADACAQSRFVLPQALCEDWRFPDDEHVAEYCVPHETLECTELCEYELGAVSPACNAALHRAIPCLARSELYHEDLISIVCIFQECTPMLVRVSAECNGLRQELARARELWASAGSDSYSYELSTGSSVVDIVVSGGVASAVGGTPMNVPTIPELFDRIEGSLEFVTLSVTYDAMLGYPREAGAHSTGCSGDEGYVSGYSFAVTDLVLE